MKNENTFYRILGYWIFGNLCYGQLYVIFIKFYSRIYQNIDYTIKI